MEIYKGRGDHGKTSLFSEERVAKSHERIEAIGDIDELNSVLGVLVAALPEDRPELKVELERVQAILISAGAWLATTPGSPRVEHIPEIDDREAGRLEAAIDRMEARLPPLTGFILPGGHLSAAFAHVARTVCRRAERHVVRLAADSGEGRAHVQLLNLLTFLNRLSAYLFELARYLNILHGFQDGLWKKPEHP